MTERSRTPMRDWMEHHKFSTIYICAALTALLILQILDTAGVVGA